MTKSNDCCTHLVGDRWQNTVVERYKKKPESGKSQRHWKKEPLIYEDIDAAVIRARERLADTPDFIAKQDRLGWERALIYKTLILTGLRQGELSAITLKDVYLGEKEQRILLPAAFSKDRKSAVILLRDDLAIEIAQWIASKSESEKDDRQPSAPWSLPPETPLFDVSDKMIKILNRDLAAANIPKRDYRGYTVDMHALRHTFGTHLSKAGVLPRVAQSVMRHKKVDLTMNYYTDEELLNLQGAVDALPELPLAQSTLKTKNLLPTNERLHQCLHQMRSERGIRWQLLTIRGPHGTGVMNRQELTIALKIAIKNTRCQFLTTSVVSDPDGT